MQRTYLSINLVDEGNTALPPEYIESFKFSTSVFSAYPRAEIIYNDKEGRMMALLLIKPGNFIQFVFQDIDTQKVYEMTPLIVSGVESLDKDEGTGGGKTSSLGGQMKIHLIHPWEVYTDWSNQGFDQSISDIVIDLAQRSKQGWSFSKIAVDGTDDSQGTIRYKLQESESEFIVNKLLPYATVDSQAAYAFVNEKNEFHLHNFKALYGKESRAVLVPRPEDLSQSPATAKALAAFSGKKAPHFINDGHWALGPDFKDQIRALSVSIMVEESKANVTFKGDLAYVTPIPGYTLIKKDYITSLVATSAVGIPHRLLEDAVRLVINHVGILNTFLTVTVTTTLILDVAMVGETIDLLLASTPEEPHHWMNGKWVIGQAEHFAAESQYFTQMLLMKPVIDAPSAALAKVLFKSENA